MNNWRYWPDHPFGPDRLTAVDWIVGDGQPFPPEYDPARGDTINGERQEP